MEVNGAHIIDMKSLKCGKSVGAIFLTSEENQVPDIFTWYQTSQNRK